MSLHVREHQWKRIPCSGVKSFEIAAITMSLLRVLRVSARVAALWLPNCVKTCYGQRPFWNLTSKKLTHNRSTRLLLYSLHENWVIDLVCHRECKILRNIGERKFNKCYTMYYCLNYSCIIILSFIEHFWKSVFRRHFHKPKNLFHSCSRICKFTYPIINCITRVILHLINV